MAPKTMTLEKAFGLGTDGTPGPQDMPPKQAMPRNSKLLRGKIAPAMHPAMSSAQDAWLKAHAGKFAFHAMKRVKRGRSGS